MSKILTTLAGLPGQNITSPVSAGSYTPSRDLALAARLKLTSLNAAAATFTLRLEDASGYVLASLAVPKDTAADTTAYLYLAVPLVKSSEAVTLKVESSNSSDTSVTWTTEWIDADWVNTGLIEGSDATDQINAACDAALTDYDAVVPADLPTNFGDLSITATTGLVAVDDSTPIDANAVQISGSSDAADNVESVYLGTGHTDGVEMSAKQLKLEGNNSGEGSLHIDNTAPLGNGIQASGTTNGIQASGDFADISADITGSISGNISGTINGLTATAQGHVLSALTDDDTPLDASAMNEIAADWTDDGRLDTILDATATASELTAAKNDIVGADGDTLETLSDQLDAVQSKTDTIGSLEVTYSTLSVSDDDTFAVYGNCDYLAADGTQIAVTVSDYAGPSMSGGSVAMRLIDRDSYLSDSTDSTALEYDGTISQSGTTLTIGVDMTATETGALAPNPPATTKNYRFQVIGTTSGGSVVPLAEGWLTVKKGFTTAT
jgi:hypothetical protein